MDPQARPGEAPGTESVAPKELHGMEAFFDLPGPRPPVRWKMALLTWLVICPLILGLSVVLGPVLAGVPPPVRVAVISAFLVPIMTWVVMPFLTRRLDGWLRA